MGDRRKCQTYTASPAEPGGLPVMLELYWRTLAGDSSKADLSRYDDARRRARSLGFEYIDNHQLLTQPPEERLDRLETLVARGVANDYLADRVPEHPQVPAISLIVLPLIKCSRRIRAIVSTTSIPHHLLPSKAGSATGQPIGGQFGRRSPSSGGALPHPECYWTTSRR
jgi:hypothetical protein